MPSLTQPRSFRPARRLKAKTLSICVVDPRQDDFEACHQLACEAGVRLQFVATASEALRLARTGSVDLWVVSTRLADRSGFELCSMLRASSPQGAVCLVADEYSSDAELAAWQHRASAFTVKPGYHVWLDEWLASRPIERRHSPAPGGVNTA